MKKFSLADAKPYAAAKHFNMTAMRLQGKEETGIKSFWVGISYFLPGGGAEWAYEDNPCEKVYIVLDGEITVKNKGGSYFKADGFPLSGTIRRAFHTQQD